MSAGASQDRAKALAEKHGATSYRNRADTQHPAYGFTPIQLAALIADVEQAARRAPVVPVETLETEYASCLAQCRDAFPVPDVNTKLEGLWVAAMGCPSSVPEYIKAIAAAPQPPEQQETDK